MGIRPKTGNFRESGFKRNLNGRNASLLWMPIGNCNKLSRCILRYMAASPVSLPIRANQRLIQDHRTSRFGLFRFSGSSGIFQIGLRLGIRCRASRDLPTYNNDNKCAQNHRNQYQHEFPKVTRQHKASPLFAVIFGVCLHQVGAENTLQ